MQDRMAMPKHRFFYLLAAVLALAALSGCGLSLAEDIEPPANYREQVEPTEQPAVESTSFPLVPPDLAQGQEIYAEKCLPCHGESGMGDGPQSVNLSNPAAALGSPSLARLARPVDWYQIVTRGNIERLMPGFASLSDRERWDVVAYSLTLSVTQAELDQGKAIYAQNCAACHAMSAQGDGEQAAELETPPADWRDQERLARLSAADMAGVMAGGDGHPDLSADLDEDQRYAAAAYVRTLGNASPGGAAAVEESAPTVEGEAASSAAPAGSITISGAVTNASPGGALPSGMQATVLAYQDMSLAFELTGDVAADGSYVFDDVAFDENYVYFVQVLANGLTFTSDILHASDISGAAANLPVQIYETTTAIDALRADRMHIFFDFSMPGKVQIVNLYIISNLGSEAVTSAEPDEPVLEVELPAGAENLQFQDGELGGRFVQTGAGFADRMSIIPGAGQHQILFAYDLPYTSSLDLAINPPVAVDSAIVMMPPGGVKLESSTLASAGERDVQGEAYLVYQSMASFEAGETLHIKLSGKTSGASDDVQGGSVNQVLIGVGVFGLALAGVGYWLARMRAGSQPAVEAAAPVAAAPESSDALVDAIVALDDLHAAGQIPEAAYQERRTDLKARLAELLKKEA